MELGALLIPTEIVLPTAAVWGLAHSVGLAAGGSGSGFGSGADSGLGSGAGSGIGSGGGSGSGAGAGGSAEEAGAGEGVSSCGSDGEQLLVVSGIRLSDAWDLLSGLLSSEELAGAKVGSLS